MSECDVCKDGIDAVFHNIEKHIREYGHSVIFTGADSEQGELSMAYTIGLSDVGLNEIVVFGLPAETAHVLLNDTAKLLREGKLKCDQPVTELANMPLYFKKVSAEIASCYIVQANNRAGKKLQALQMIWPDPSGRFPWDDGFDASFSDKQLKLYRAFHRW